MSPFSPFSQVLAYRCSTAAWRKLLALWSVWREDHPFRWWVKNLNESHYRSEEKGSIQRSMAHPLTLTIRVQYVWVFVHSFTDSLKSSNTCCRSYLAQEVKNLQDPPYLIETIWKITWKIWWKTWWNIEVHPQQILYRDFNGRRPGPEVRSWGEPFGEGPSIVIVILT